MKKTIQFEDCNPITIYFCDCCGKQMVPFVNTWPGKKNIESGYRCPVCGYKDGLSCDTVLGGDCEDDVLARQERWYD